MLTGIRVTNPQRADLPELDLPLYGQNRFPIAFVDGLNPVTANMSASAYANYPGEHYQGSRVGTRNIVLTLDLEPSYDVGGEDPETLRRELYGYFAPQSHVDFEFVTDKHVRYISGVVETFEAPLFVQNPQVQISILCHHPHFLGEPLVPAEYTWTANPNTTPITIVNNGDIPVGFVLDAVLNGTGTSLEITAEGSMTVTKAYTSGSTLKMDSRPFRKNVTDASGVNAWFPYIVSGSVWPQLKPGPNTLIFRRSGGTAGTNNIVVDFREEFVGL